MRLSLRVFAKKVATLDLSEFFGTVRLVPSLSWRVKDGATIAPNTLVCELESEKICVSVCGHHLNIDRNVVLTRRLVPEDSDCDCDCQVSLDLFEYNDEDCATAAQDHRENENLAEIQQIRDEHSHDNSCRVRSHAANLAIRYIFEGNAVKAIEVIANERQTSKTFDCLHGFLACVAYRQAGDLSRAAKELEVIEQFRRDSNLGLCLKNERAILAYLTGDLVGARRLWCELLMHDEEIDKLRTHDHFQRKNIHDVAVYSLAALHAAEGKLDRAITACAKLLPTMTDTNTMVRRRVVGLLSQLREIEAMFGTKDNPIVLKKSNAPFITVLPSYMWGFKRQWQGQALPMPTMRRNELTAAFDGSAQRSEIIEMLANMTNVVAITGSGISVASGLKTRQDLWESGQWQRDKCVSVFGEMDVLWRLVHSFLADADPVTLEPVPNAAHYALTELERCGVVGAIVTQNVDGLHQLAKSKNVIELHGSLMRVKCASCGCMQQQSCVDYLHRVSAQPSSCTRCGQPKLRPDVVLFGEVVAQTEYSQASKAIADADALLIVGTACDVSPTADLIARYAETKKPIIEIAKQSSLITHRFRTLFFEPPAETFFHEILAAKKKH